MSLNFFAWQLTSDHVLVHGVPPLKCALAGTLRDGAYNSISKLGLPRRELLEGLQNDCRLELLQGRLHDADVRQDRVAEVGGHGVQVKEVRARVHANVEVQLRQCSHLMAE